MHLKWLARLLLFFILLNVTSGSALAFNGQRSGFMLGIGLGAHGFKADIEGWNHGGLATTFRLGAGISERFQVYAFNDLSWFNRDSERIYYSLYGLGVNWFFSDFTPSYYLRAGVGVTRLADYHALSESSIFDRGKGTGLLIGTGYEIRKHVNLEIALFHSTIEAELIVNEYDATTLQLLLNFNLY